MLHGCPSGQLCLEIDGSAECTSDWCHPGSPVCEGTVLTVCADNGYDHVPGGTDCALSGQVCSAARGACRELICEPNLKWCSDAGDVVGCDPEGTSVHLIAECANDQVCRTDTVACAAIVCAAESPACDGEVATLCRSDGAGFVGNGTDCAANGMFCDQGVCAAEQICPPNGFVCSGGDIYRCSPRGGAMSLVQDCDDAQHCYVWYDTARCALDVCTPGAPACNGSFLATCLADGSGPSAGGVDCAATGQNCDAAAAECRDVICTPGATACQDGDLFECSSSGTSWHLYIDCGEQSYCDDALVGCVPLP
jgi:hypothetical protein